MLDVSRFWLVLMSGYEHSCAQLCISVRYTVFSHSCKCVVISYCGFDLQVYISLMINGMEYTFSVYWSFLHCLICHKPNILCSYFLVIVYFNSLVAFFIL